MIHKRFFIHQIGNGNRDDIADAEIIDGIDIVVQFVHHRFLVVFNQFHFRFAVLADKSDIDEIKWIEEIHFFQIVHGFFHVRIGHGDFEFILRQCFITVPGIDYSIAVAEIRRGIQCSADAVFDQQCCIALVFAGLFQRITFLIGTTEFDPVSEIGFKLFGVEFRSGSSQRIITFIGDSHIIIEIHFHTAALHIRPDAGTQDQCTDKAEQDIVENMSLLFLRLVLVLFQKYGGRAQVLGIIFIVERFLFKNRFCFLRDLFHRFCRGLFPFSSVEIFQNLFDPGNIFRSLCSCLFFRRFRYGRFFLAHQGFPFELLRSAQGAKFRSIIDLCATTNTLHELLLLNQ